MGDAIQHRTSLRPDPGSFRDWDGRVFVSSDGIVRALSGQGVANWTALEATDLYRRHVADGSLVPTRPAEATELDELRAIDPVWEGALVHERVPFISYPYEWTFSMLQDAALLQLELTAEAISEGLILKDASPYNVQWIGARPTFIDVGSFELLREGEAWSGYRQFCALYLYPLLLEAYKGVPFQPWLRGSPGGIAPEDVRGIFSARDLLRRGVLRHVVLHARLERGNAHRSAEVRDELRAAGMSAQLVAKGIESLAALVRGLRPGTHGGTWGAYRETCSYDEGDIAAKDEFVRRAVGLRRRHLVWDLGCNDGRYSQIASQGSELTLAIDSDPAVVDTLYRTLREEGSTSVSPLVVDLVNPSAAVGWRNAERSTLLERGRPELVLCLALVHHLSIANNVPLVEIVEWLRSLECEVVVEFPHREDPMVQRLLAAKRSDAHPDYDRVTFGALLGLQLDVVDSVELPSETRTLFLVRPR